MINTRHTQTAYTDGAASGNPGPSGWAVLLESEMISGRIECATNNQMELFAIYQACTYCKPNCTLTIVTDSKLAIGWLGKGWRSNVPALTEIIQATLETAKDKNVTLNFLKVKGHANDVNNNKVDVVARCWSRTLHTL